MFSVILSNEKNETLTLDYSLNESVSAKLWFESLKKAATQSQIDSSRFYNFFSGNELPALTARLEFAIKSLGLDFGALDKASDQSLQKSLNLLHQNFAHNHLVAKSIRPENLNLWSEFNEIIHTIESVLVAKKNCYAHSAQPD